MKTAVLASTIVCAYGRKYPNSHASKCTVTKRINAFWRFCIAN